MEMRCLLHISHHKINEIVCNKTQTAIGPYEDILTTVKKRKLRWFGHVIRSSGLCKKVVQDVKTTSESGPDSTSTAAEDRER